MLKHRMLKTEKVGGGDEEQGSSRFENKIFNDSDRDQDDNMKKHMSRQLFSEGMHFSIKFAKKTLRTTALWGALVFIGYLIGSEALPKTILSVNWLFKPPPTLKQIYHSRNCHEILNSTRPLYTEEQWQRFRDIWKLQGGEDPSHLYKRHDRRKSKAPRDFVPPIRAGYTTDGRGRGIFATRDIKKGEMTYGGTKHYIFFFDGHSYRRYLDALSDEEACDMMKFTWPQDGVGRNGEAVIWGPMDDMALQNDGGKDGANIGCPEDKHCGMVSSTQLFCFGATYNGL